MDTEQAVVGASTSIGSCPSGPVSPSVQSAAAIAAASRRRKQSKPRQLASTEVDSEDLDASTTPTTAAAAEG